MERRENWKKNYIKNTYNWCDFFSFVSPSCDFTGHLRFWPQKYFVQNWWELFTRKKLTVIIFRNFMTLSRWERKMKIWENGKMTKNKCVSYWNKKTSTIIFLKKKCYLHFFIEIVVNQNVILDIFRHVELTNDIVWRIEGFRG